MNIVYGKIIELDSRGNVIEDPENMLGEETREAGQRVFIFSDAVNCQAPLM